MMVRELYQDFVVWRQPECYYVDRCLWTAGNETPVKGDVPESFIYINPELFMTYGTCP